MTVNKRGFMLIEVMLILLFVSTTCCSLLAGYSACVLAMQHQNRLELALELAEATDLEKAELLAAEQGLLIERKEYSDNLHIKQKVTLIRENGTNKIVVNKVRYALP